jgi:hypothetical protein
LAYLMAKAAKVERAFLAAEITSAGYDRWVHQGAVPARLKARLSAPT